MSIEAFSDRIPDYLKLTGHSKKNLADALGLHPTQLSHKLHHTANRVLTFAEIQNIIKILAEWEAISTKAEALELLALAHCPSFSLQEWASPPLNRLEVGNTDHLATRAVNRSKSIDLVTEKASKPGGKSISQSNLPVPLTSFVGRKKELNELKELITSTTQSLRLLTLLGTGGVGKTRLMVEVASGLVEHFEAGVWLVELASLTDPTLLAQAICNRLGLSEQPMRPLQATLTDYLRPKELLLLLDNCEHLLDECARLVAHLLQSCPRLKILTTSRESLSVPGELHFRVPSLALPEPGKAASLCGEALEKWEAVQLFVERSQLERPGLRLTDRNWPYIVQICQQLDGIPLALELAAARLGGMSLEQIASRLDQRFRLLTTGSRTVLPRHRTLLALIDWSYELLAEEEKVLLRALAVFRGGWTLEGAEAASGGAGFEKAEVEDLLLQLVNKSLVMAEEEEESESESVTALPRRFTMLETIRQYAFEKLVERGEQERQQCQHCLYFVKLAEEAKPAFTGPDQSGWLGRLEQEHNNFRAALSWLQDPARGSQTPAELAAELEVGDLSQASWAEISLRLSEVLWRFWYVRGYLSEGSNRLEAILSQARAAHPAVPASLLVRVWFGAAGLAFFQGDYHRAASLFEKSLTLSRAQGDRKGVARTLYGLGNIANVMGESQQAVALYEESIALFRELDDTGSHLAIALTNLVFQIVRQGENERALALTQEALNLLYPLGDKWGIALTKLNWGVVLIWRREYEVARPVFGESLTQFEALGDKRMAALARLYLGDIARVTGEIEQAIALIKEVQQVFSELGDKWNYALSLRCLGDVALSQGQYREAESIYREGLSIIYGLGTKLLMANLLLGLAASTLKQQRLGKAIKLCGAAEARRQASGEVWSPENQVLFEQTRQEACQQTARITFDQLYAEGQALNLAQTITLALEDKPGLVQR